MSPMATSLTFVGRVDRLLGGAGAPAAAADQADLDHVAAGRVGVRREAQARQGRPPAAATVEALGSRGARRRLVDASRLGHGSISPGSRCADPT